MFTYEMLIRGISLLPKMLLRSGKYQAMDLEIIGESGRGVLRAVADGELLRGVETSG